MTTPPHLPEQDMLIQLHHQEGAGTYEAHVTIRAEDATTRDRFREWCRILGVKCVLIELPEGETRSQPMTASYHHGSLANVVAEVGTLTQRVRGAGFAVQRLKLEAVATNEGLPETDADVGNCPEGNYFEFHVKLLLPPDAATDRLKTLVATHEARLSGNAFKARPDGTSEQFVTQRVYRAGRNRAFAQLAALVDDLAAAGFEVIHQLKEYTIYDSAVNLDAGWLDPPTAEA